VLKELIEHHIEEEETEIFKKAKDLLSKEQLTDLGAHMESRRRTILAELKAT
jgi:hypothetical protein